MEKNTVKIDPEKMHFMPLVIGPLGNQKGVASVYKKAQTVALQYVTELEAIATLLPDCYQLAEQPIVTVAFIHNDGVDCMAGRGYRIATVMVTARFDGERDHVDPGDERRRGESGRRGGVSCAAEAFDFVSLDPHTAPG